MAGLGDWCWRVLGFGVFGASLGSADDRDSELGGGRLLEDGSAAVRRYGCLHSL